MTPNDPKLSDCGGRRGTCMAGGKAAGWCVAASVTPGAVLCSARLCEKAKKLIFGSELSMTYKSSSTTYVSSEEFSHSLAHG